LPDEKLLKVLKRERKKKRDDYPVTALWRSLVVGMICGHFTIAALIRELKRNAELRQICGFDDIKGDRSVPPDYVYSRFCDKLDSHWELIEKMFNDLLRDVAELLPDFGRDLAIDSKAIPVPGKKCVDADTGTKQYENADGTFTKLTWFGYKLHLIVDALYELPIGFKVTAASAADSPQLMPMIEELKEKQPKIIENTERASLDKAYDSAKIKAELYDDFGIIPLIPPRNMLANKEDPIRPLDPTRSDTIYKGPTGEIYCKCHPFETDPEKMFVLMQFQGFEKKRNTLKFRCPAMAFGAKCNNREACQCNPRVRDGKFGRIVRVPIDLDRRVFLPQHVHSQGFKEQYKKRTSVERVNYRLDHVHGFENTRLRSLKAVRMRVGISLLVMLASARSWIHAGKVENIRSILSAAA